MNADEIVLDHLMERILGNALTVSNALGAGFLEIVLKLQSGDPGEPDVEHQTAGKFRPLSGEKFLRGPEYPGLYPYRFE